MKNILQRSRWIRLVLSVLFFAAMFIVGAFFSVAGGSGPGDWIIFVKVGAVFGLLGAIYGAIYALDIRADSSNIDRPVLRTLVCAVLGGLLVFYAQISVPLTQNFVAVIIGAAVAGSVGWVGWRWAKYVDF